MAFKMEICHWVKTGGWYIDLETSGLLRNVIEENSVRFAKAEDFPLRHSIVCHITLSFYFVTY